jgi:hypothetical protein
MRAVYRLMWLLLPSAPAWAGCCGHGPSDTSLLGILVGALTIFLVSGPLLGAVLSELLLVSSGHRFRLSRVAWSILYGTLLCAALAFLLGSTLGAIGLASPLAGLLAALHKSAKLANASQASQSGPEIGFSPEI